IGLMPERATLGVLGDGRADEPRLAVPNVGVGLTELDSAVPRGLHLGAGQDDTGLDALDELVIAARATVLCDQLRSGRLFGHVGSLMVDLAYKDRSAAAAKRSPSGIHARSESTIRGFRSCAQLSVGPAATVARCRCRTGSLRSGSWSPTRRGGSSTV